MGEGFANTGRPLSSVADYLRWDDAVAQQLREAKDASSAWNQIVREHYGDGAAARQIAQRNTELTALRQRVTDRLFNQFSEAANDLRAIGRDSRTGDDEPAVDAARDRSILGEPPAAENGWQELAGENGFNLRAAARPATAGGARRRRRDGCSAIAAWLRVGPPGDRGGADPVGTTTNAGGVHEPAGPAPEETALARAAEPAESPTPAAAPPSSASAGCSCSRPTELESVAPPAAARHELETVVANFRRYNRPKVRDFTSLVDRETMARDVARIRAGEATQSIDAVTGEQHFVIDGREYGSHQYYAHQPVTLYPMTGPGITRLSDPELEAFGRFVSEGGDNVETRAWMERAHVRKGTLSQAQVDRAREAYIHDGRRCRRARGRRRTRGSRAGRGTRCWRHARCAARRRRRSGAGRTTRRGPRAARRRPGRRHGARHGIGAAHVGSHPRNES